MKVYLDSKFNPTSPEKAALVKVIQDNGRVTFYRPERPTQKAVRPRGISLSEFVKGFQHESREHLNTVGGNRLTVARLVLDHLKENPSYYSELEQKGMG